MILAIMESKVQGNTWPFCGFGVEVQGNFGAVVFVSRFILCYSKLFYVVCNAISHYFAADYLKL